MLFQEVIYLIVWAVISFLIAFYLQKKYSFFKKLFGVLTLLGCFILFVFLHNVIYGLFHIEEPVFFLLSLFSLGASVFLLIIQIIKKIIKK